MAVVTGFLTQAASANEEWLLLAREGGCHPVSSLKRRLPDLPDIRDPEGFQRYLESKGFQFTRKAHSGNPGKSVEFVVAEKSLALVLVTRGSCKPY